jgi:hypothetical protein
MQQHTPISDKATVSEGEKVSEIQSLALRARDLSQAVDRWNTAMIWALVLTALAAVLVVVTTRVALTKAKKLAGVQEELIRAKDAQLTSDLKEKDAKIADTNERAAALEVEALKLRKQLLGQGPRGNLLAGENRRKLVDALKPFSGQKIDVRHSASTIMVNGSVVMSTPIGDDALGLANALIGVLKDAGWNLPPTPLISGFQGHGVEVGILHNASRETRAAAEALVDALRQVPLAVSGPSPVTDDGAKRVGTEVILPAFDENTIILFVLTYP